MTFTNGIYFMKRYLKLNFCALCFCRGQHIILFLKYYNINMWCVDAKLLLCTLNIYLANPSTCKCCNVVFGNPTILSISKEFKEPTGTCWLKDNQFM